MINEIFNLTKWSHNLILAFWNCVLQFILLVDLFWMGNCVSSPLMIVVRIYLPPLEGWVLMSFSFSGGECLCLGSQPTEMWRERDKRGGHPHLLFLSYDSSSKHRHVLQESLLTLLRNLHLLLFFSFFFFFLLQIPTMAADNCDQLLLITTSSLAAVSLWNNTRLPFALVCLLFLLGSIFFWLWTCPSSLVIFFSFCAFLWMIMHVALGFSAKKRSSMSPTRLVSELFPFSSLDIKDLFVSRTWIYKSCSFYSWACRTMVKRRWSIQIRFQPQQTIKRLPLQLINYIRWPWQMAANLRRVQSMKPLKRSRTLDEFQILLFKESLRGHFPGPFLTPKITINTRVLTRTTPHQRHILLLTTEQLTQYERAVVEPESPRAKKIPTLFCCYHMPTNVHLSCYSITYTGWWILYASKPFLLCPS